MCAWRVDQMVKMNLLIPFTFIFYLLSNTIAFSNDFSEGVTKDMASQCFKTQKQNALDYNRTLKSNYTYIKAIRKSSIMKESIMAQIGINIKDNYNESFNVSCTFDSQARVVCFADPFNLSNKNGILAASCWNTPKRF
jgi:hypothetical protein